jgi:hypothetical protein
MHLAPPTAAEGVPWTRELQDAAGRPAGKVAQDEAL